MIIQKMEICQASFFLLGNSATKHKFIGLLLKFLVFRKQNNSCFLG